MNTYDINHIVGTYLMYEGYDDVKTVPIDVLKEQIKNYILYKIQYFGEDLDLMGSLSKLEEQTSSEEKDKAMGNFIHFLLSFFSMLQGFEMVWYIDDTVVDPVLKRSTYDENKYDGLVTNEKIDYKKTFQFMLDEIEKAIEREQRVR